MVIRLPTDDVGAEQGREHLGAVAGRWRRRWFGPIRALPLVVGQDVGSGVHKLKVHSHEIMCARTSEERTALLIVTALSEPVVPGSTITLDVIAWDPVAYRG
jgi:hypothetical protein